ncbi:acyl-CoA dehydrogenase family protein [Paenibacillus chartarius]|uniref:Acyl-CoA dehydrogenase family protein n=1 Tax=Paenibacillus chartarius TaxID=747481 RepID=A0ABV6DTB5_9BACL
MNEPIRFPGYPRTEREAQLCRLADGLAASFAQRAAEHDRNGTFPFDNYDELRSTGFVRLPLPREYGGEELTLYELLLVQERLARGDGSTALAIGWHMGLLLQLRTTRAWAPEQFDALCRAVQERGALLNSFATEPASGSPSRGGMPRTTAVRTEDGWVLTGRKTFSTLSPAADFFLVKASIQGTEQVGEFLIPKNAGIQIEETWDTIGMRATGSHDIVLDQVAVPENALIVSDPERKQLDAGGWLLHIPACYLGIAQAAAQFAVKFAKEYRPAALPGPIAELEHIRHKIGLMEAKLRTARTQLFAAAAAWDDAPEHRSGMQTELGLAKYVTTNSAIEVVDLAMRIVGGSALSRSLPLERYYRDVRAGLSNPPMDDAVLRSLALEALCEAPNK